MRNLLVIVPLSTLLFILAGCGQSFKDSEVKVNKIQNANTAKDKAPVDLGIVRTATGGVDVLGDQFKLTLENPAITEVPKTAEQANDKTLTDRQFQTSATFKLVTSSATDTFDLKTLENRKTDKAGNPSPTGDWTGAADAKALNNYSAILITRCFSDDCASVYGLLQLSVMKNANEFADIRECAFKLISKPTKLEQIICLGRGEKFGTMDDVIRKYEEVYATP